MIDDRGDPVHIRDATDSKRTFMGLPIDETPETPDERKARLRQEATRIGRQEFEEKKATLQEKRVTGLEIPAEYSHATIESFELHGSEQDQETQRRVWDSALQWVNSWPADWPERVLLGSSAHVPFDSEVPLLQVWRGNPGTGKTHLAYSIGRRLAETRAVGFALVKLPDLVRKLRSAWGPVRDTKAETEDRVLRRYRRYDLLVIDEVSSHAFGGDARGHLYDVIDDRLSQLRPTLVITNDTESKLAEFLDDALISRVNGAGGVIEFGDADYRAVARTERQVVMASKVVQS